MIERTALSFVLIWGNWAMYYWIVVLVFDGSYLALKNCAPIYLLQLVASFSYFARLGLHPAVASESLMPSERPPGLRRLSGKQLTVVVVCAMMLSGGAILLISHFNWSKTAPVYNLLWVTLLPIAVYYLYRFATPAVPVSAPSLAPSARAVTFDTLLFLLGTVLFVYLFYDYTFFRADDAFYGNVISSTLARPELPVQGMDALLGTGSPYTLHPAYRGVGYEVLIALVSDLTHSDPLHWYYKIFPALNSVFWLCSWYLFCRILRTPYPGLAVIAGLLILLLWAGPHASPYHAVRSLNWGKSLLALVATPVLFTSVAVFVWQKYFASWVLLLLSVCSLAILSSSAVFLVPVSIGLACLVLLSFRWSSLRIMLLIVLAALPVVLLIVYSLSVSLAAPVYATGTAATGPLILNGEALGGVQLQAIALALLLILPLAARTVADGRFQHYILRLCLAGYFTLMAPYLVELVTVVSGMNFLSVRIYAAFPFALLVGIMASIAALNLTAGRSAAAVMSAPRRIAVLALVAAFFGVIIGETQRNFFRPNRRLELQEQWESHLQEAIAARALIKDDAMVAAGTLEIVLPILPDPPQFVRVRHYLTYHKLRLTERDYADREYLCNSLQALEPPQGENLDTTVTRTVAIAEALGVTTLVFEADNLTTGKQQFSERLTARLTAEGYDCATTPSASTRVCNR